MSRNLEMSTDMIRIRAMAAPPRRQWYWPCKAAADFVAAAALLVLFAPLILLAMAAVKLTSRGPAIYSQARLGKDGRRFTIFKIRTMAHDCERDTGARWATPRDPRVTPVGRFLREAHLDELPQLWNVLRGDMGLVGPRPERPEFVLDLEREVPHYRQRMDVRPGITGLAQVQLPPDTNVQSVRQKLAYDLFYVGQAGPWLDARILLATVMKVAGVRFDLTRVLVGLPSDDVIEEAYNALSTDGASPTTQMQPA